MEENKKTPVEGNAEKKLTYDQLSQFNQLLQRKYAEAEARLQQIENVCTRMDYLFKVLDNSQYFSDDFVGSCANEIQNIIDVRQEEETAVQ